MVDPELLEYLQKMETRMTAASRDMQTETLRLIRGEIQHAKEDGIAASRDMQTETLRLMRGEIQQAKDDGIAAARDMQTETLRYIGNVAEPFNVRMRHIEANASNLDTAERLRLAAVEERLLRIEKKLLGEAP